MTHCIARSRPRQESQWAEASRATSLQANKIILISASFSAEKYIWTNHQKNGELSMSGCLKGDSEVKKKEAKFKCEKCGALTDKKKHICKPEKIKGKQPKK